MIVIAATVLVTVASADPAAAGLVVALPAGATAILVALVFRLAPGAISRPAAVAALVWGALVAPLVAAPAYEAWARAIAGMAGGMPEDFMLAPTAAPIEEAIKLLGVALVAVGWPRSIRGARTGLIVGLLVGAGFAATEDMLYAAAVVTAGVSEPAGAVGLMFVTRAVASGLFLHAAFTGIAGAGFGWALAGPSPARWAAAIGALLVAMALHAVANAGVMLPPDLPWQIEDGIALVGITLLRSIPFAIAMVLLLRLPKEPESG